jgi:hypothetical protein
MDKYFKDNVTDREALAYLIGEHIALSAQVEAQKQLLTLLLQFVGKEDPEKVKQIAKSYPDFVQHIFQSRVANHYLLSGYWKKYLSENLGDIEGIKVD